VSGAYFWSAVASAARPRFGASQGPLEISRSEIQSAIDASLCRRTPSFAFTQEIEE